MKAVIAKVAGVFFICMLALTFISRVAYEYNTAKVTVSKYMSGTIGDSIQYYEKCIPVAALRRGIGNRYYVLVTGSEETVLGEELVAVRAEVKVLKQNAEIAAIQSEMIGAETEIICASSKEIDEGSRMRIGSR